MGLWYMIKPVILIFPQTDVPKWGGLFQSPGMSLWRPLPQVWHVTKY